RRFRPGQATTLKSLGQATRYSPQARSMWCSTHTFRCAIASLADIIKTLGKIGYQFDHFLFGPGAARTGAHVSQGTERKRELCDVVAVRSLQEDEQVPVAGGEINVLDGYAGFLRDFARLLGAFGNVLYGADALIGPTQRANKKRHVILPWRRLVAAGAALR